MHAMAEAILERLAHLQVRFSNLTNCWAHLFKLYPCLSLICCPFKLFLLVFMQRHCQCWPCSCHWQKKYETGRMEGRGGTMWSITMEEAASLGECTTVPPQAMPERVIPLRPQSTKHP
jgi:hypothetical protein